MLEWTNTMTIMGKVQQGASTADLIKQMEVPVNSKTRHLKLSHRRRRNKRRMQRVKKGL